MAVRGSAWRWSRPSPICTEAWLTRPAWAAGPRASKSIFLCEGFLRPTLKVPSCGDADFPAYPRRSSRCRGDRLSSVWTLRPQRREPGLLVLGGKHHTALERWLGGSTSLHVVRTSEVPVLITAGAPSAPQRVLVAADLSKAAGPTVALAERFARLVGAQLRVITVFEPLPNLPGIPPMDAEEYYALAQETLERDIWPLVKRQGIDKLVRHGMVVDTLLREATEWQADVLVVGSHGKGWAQRVLLGSVTERLINHLPTSLLVAPVGVAAAALAKGRQRQVALVH